MASNRFFFDNVMFQPDVVYVPSSEEPQLPAEHLRDQLRQAIWQTQGPWVITSYNKYIDFNRGGVKVATIAEGTYATGSALCTAIVAALNAADPSGAGLTWAADYNVAAAYKFRIRNTAGVPVGFNLLWSSGANKYQSVALCIGFITSADTGSVITATATNQSFQSRHYLVLYRSSDATNIRALTAILLEHNLSATAVVTWEANATNAWSAPTTSQNYAGTPSDPWLLEFPSLVAEPYYRLTVNDTLNADGFFQVGIIHLGDIDTPTYCATDSLEYTRQDFSSLVQSISGATFGSTEPARETWALEYMDMPAGGADETLLDQVREIPVGETFFFQFDDTDIDTLFYVCKLDGGQKKCVAAGRYWTYVFAMAEMI